VKVAQATEKDQIQFGVDESYTLTIGSPISTITAPTTWGALRGLETFSQLLMRNPASFTIASATVTDFPRFGWRGLLIDTSRHWLPVKTIKETISAMSFSKLNTLHWHIVDGQSFPFESKSFPLLQTGAYRPNQVYTQDQIKDIISFANDHGVRILPEFDMPAHATSWGFGYPFLIVPCNPRSSIYDFNDGWGDQPMDPTNPNVYQFIAKFLSEVAALFPDNWLHLGGDEVEYSCWNTTRINKYMKENGIATFQDLETLFILEVNKRIQGLGKQTIYWQEVFQNTNPFIGDSVDVWKDSTTLAKVIAAGKKGIQSFGWYLDNLGAGWVDFYNQDPIPPKTPPSQKALVLGGETSMWGESIDVSNIHQRIWVRAAAVAERLWSAETVTNATAALPRLLEHRCRIMRRGIPSSPFAPGPGCY